MPRAFLLCLTIVAAFGPRSAAAAVSEDVPVPQEIVSAARALGLDPSRDRGRFVAELTRLLYTPPPGRSPVVDRLLRPERFPAARGPEIAVRVPVPLSAEVWGRVIFRRTIRPEQLLSNIAADRRAALVCHALAALDDETLAYLEQHPAILTRLYEEDAAAFAAFGASLRIREGRVVPPGGSAAIPLWEAAVGFPVAQPDRFLRALYGDLDARLGYLFDTIASLDAPKASFALGLWIPDPQLRAERFLALCGRVIGSYREWQLPLLPFSRPLYDIGMLFFRLEVLPSGAPAAPDSRLFWNRVFQSDSLDVGDVSAVADVEAEAPMDAAALAEAMGSSDLYWRGDRLDQLAFGQRVFASVTPDDWPAAIVAIRALPRQRMLMLTLERMGVTSPRVYASIAQRASRLGSGGATAAFWTLAQVQAAHALLARMTRAGTLDVADAERLVVSLYDVPVQDDRYRGGVAAWLRRQLLPRLPRADDVEEALVLALAGPPAGAAAPRLSWEGAQYRLDLAIAEAHRLRAVRRKQAGYSVGVALEIDDVARALRRDDLTAERMQELAQRLTALIAAEPSRVVPAGETRPPGLDAPRPAREIVERAIEELSRAARTRDARRASRVGSSLAEIVDEALGEALLSLAYALDLGDPDGTPMLARNVAVRHDFGFGRRDAAIRARTIWSIPRQDFLPGVPWHVTGSVLGLDIALGTLSLRRINLDRLGDAPRLPSNEREAFAISVAMLNPRLMRDRDRTAITEAISRGRRRVAGLAAGRQPFDEAADFLALDGWRRRAIRWMITNDASALPSMFTLAEMVQLGGGATGTNLDAWGMTALSSRGCACTRFETPRHWRLLSGRPQVPLVAASVPDLNLHIALRLEELQLPAALAPPVLAAAVQDFIETVAPNDPNDWWTIVRSVESMSREQIEDYVAAAAVVDGPLVLEEPAPPPDR
jgi:hypothetical protein